MKKTFIAFAILFLIVSQSVCYSEDTSSSKYSTMGATNGRAWLEMGREAKLAFIVGMYNGAAYFREVVIGRGATFKIVHEAFESLMHIPKTTYNEIVPQIDSFYADSANVNIPITRAYEIVSYKFRGEPPSKIEEYTPEFRKFYNK